ncbi:MAG: HAMP domain-containing histidine kinase [Gemmatimonadaceae bacterium]|nr:HAMP domain-containing histidine kinase [Gemmatimonadaceae bacterium]
MKSIRGRLTISYVVALTATLVIFAGILWSATQTAATRSLQRRADLVADLATIVLQQGASDIAVVITEDSLVGQKLEPRIRRSLDLLPGYVIIADSARVLYTSPAVERLSFNDRNRLVSSVFRRTPEQPAANVRMDSTANVFIVAHFERPSRRIPVARVVAGESVAELAWKDSALFLPILVTLPLILALSALVSWLLAGSALRPVDRLIYDLEAIQDGRSLHRRLHVDVEGNEIDRLAMTLNAMMARLEGSFAALRRFTADASHELKTPLTVLRADIERAMQSPHAAEDQLPALEEALAETRRMADLVDSLLTLARADEGRYDLHREPVALAPLVADVAETAQMLGEASNVSVELERADNVTVEGDVVRLRQLFLNLASNAVKYSGAQGNVSIALEDRGDHVAYVVKDSGMGIAAADLPYIFDRFWRADRVRSRTGERGGVGLGLAIAQWIAHAHGGFISVGSRLGRGSTFTVQLPLRPSGRPGPGPANPHGRLSET